MPKGTVSQICELSPTSIDLPHMGWLNCQASVCELLWTHVSCICGLSCDNLIPPGSYNPSSFSSTGFLEFGQDFFWESLHSLPSATRQCLSDDNSDIYQCDYRRWPVQTTYPLFLQSGAKNVFIAIWYAFSESFLEKAEKHKLTQRTCCMDFI